MKKSADVLIIGAGAAGLSAAANIAGSASVIVLEAEHAPCYHSTGRSMAIYVKSYGPPAVRTATAASEPFFLEPPNGFTEAPILTPRGFLYVDFDNRGLEALLATSPDLAPVSAAEAHEICPILKVEDLTAAAYETDSRDIDVDLLMTGFRRMMRDGGGEIIVNARVSSLTRTGGTWRAETPAGVFEAPVVVNAAGAWASGVAALAGGMDIGVQPCRRSVAVTPGPDNLGIDHWPLVADADESWYARPQSGKLLISPADQDPVDACDIYPDDMVLAGGIDRFSRRVDFEVKRVERTWAGLRSFSPDSEPVIGFDPGAEGFFWLAGQGGYGIQTSPAFGQLAADLTLGRAPSLDKWAIDALAPGRFAGS